MRSRVRRSGACWLGLAVSVGCHHTGALADGDCRPAGNPARAPLAVVSSSSPAPLLSAAEQAELQPICDSVYSPRWYPPGAQGREAPACSAGTGRSGCVPIARHDMVAAGCHEEAISAHCRPRVLRPLLTAAPLAQERLDRIFEQFVSLSAHSNCGLVSADFSVHHNAHGILSLTFKVEGWGAYPSDSVRHVNLELSTGEPLSAQSVFRSDRLEGLLDLLNERLRKAVAEAPPLEGFESLAAQTRAARFQHEDLNQFVVMPEGLWFHYRFDYPHAVMAIQPDDTYVVPSATAAGFVSPTGPLAWMRDAADLP